MKRRVRGKYGAKHLSQQAGQPGEESVRVGKMWEGDKSQSCEEVVDQVGKQRMWGDVVSGETLKTTKRAEEGPPQVYAHRSRSALWGKLSCFEKSA